MSGSWSDNCQAIIGVVIVEQFGVDIVEASIASWSADCFNQILVCPNLLDPLEIPKENCILVIKSKWRKEKYHMKISIICISVSIYNCHSK